MSLLTDLGAGVFAASGALAWLAPAASLGNYGLPKADISALSTMRTIGCWRLCSAAVLLAGKRSPTFAAGVGLLSAALSTLVNVANWDVLERPLGNQLPGIFVLSFLGKRVLDGAIGARWAAGIYLLMGGLIWADPKTTISTGSAPRRWLNPGSAGEGVVTKRRRRRRELTSVSRVRARACSLPSRAVYDIKKPVSDVAHSMLSLSGGAIMSTGVFLGCLAGGVALPQSIAATFATDALLALKWALTEATGLGATRMGGLIWSATSLIVGALAMC